MGGHGEVWKGMQMKVEPRDYRYKTCPHCGSKNIKPVGVVRLRNDQCQVDVTVVNRTGYICDNCDRYFSQYAYKWKTDRAEMNRDIDRLLVYLDKGARK